MNLRTSIQLLKQSRNILDNTEFLEGDNFIEPLSKPIL